MKSFCFLWKFLTKTLQNICFIFFAQQRRIQNPAKHLRYSVLQKKVNYWKPLTIFEKCSILEVWQGSEYTSAQKYTGQKKYNILGCYTCSFDSDFHHLRFTGSQRWLHGVQRRAKMFSDIFKFTSKCHSQTTPSSE